MIELITPILSIVSTIIYRRVEDKNKARELETEITKEILKLSETYITNQSKILISEINGKWFQRLWRPLLMYIIIFIIFNNFILLPYFKMFGVNIPKLELPQEFWNILLISLGGYIPLRTYEKKMLLDRIEKLSNNNKILQRKTQDKDENQNIEIEM